MVEPTSFELKLEDILVERMTFILNDANYIYVGPKMELLARFTRVLCTMIWIFNLVMVIERASKLDRGHFLCKITLMYSFRNFFNNAQKKKKRSEVRHSRVYGIFKMDSQACIIRFLCNSCDRGSRFLIWLL